MPHRFFANRSARAAACALTGSGLLNAALLSPAAALTPVESWASAAQHTCEVGGTAVYAPAFVHRVLQDFEAASSLVVATPGARLKHGTELEITAVQNPDGYDTVTFLNYGYDDSGEISLVRGMQPPPSLKVPKTSINLSRLSIGGLHIGAKFDAAQRVLPPTNEPGAGCQSTLSKYTDTKPGHMGCSAEAWVAVGREVEGIYYRSGC